MTDARTLAIRYTGWIVRRARAVIAIAIALTVVSSYLVATRLPVLADLSHLLPPDAPAVRDLRRLTERLVARDTALAIVVAPDAHARAAAMTELATRARALSRDLVERVDEDDAAERAFFSAHEHLYVPLADLEAARDALRRRIEAKKLASNPLFIDLDDEAADAGGADRARLDELRAQRRAAEARLARSRFVSADGTRGLVVIGTAFPTTDVGRGKQLLAALTDLRGEVMLHHPGVVIGFTGGVPTTIAEQTALVRGILWSSLITGVLVTLLLIAYLRSTRLVLLLVVTLVVALSVAFAVAVFTVGHLNAATAFLGAIIAGNGVNYGILLAARYREERSAAEPVAAMGRAIAGTLRPTLVASLGAAIAYGSLAATSFRGFADFAAIGATGMVLCWVVSFVLLPVLVVRFAPGARVWRPDVLWLGRVLVRAFGRIRPRAMYAVAAAITVMCAVVVARYVASDPFEYNLKQLRSTGEAAAESRRWIQISDATFGKSISGRIVFAADDPAHVPMIVAAIRAIDANLPPEQRVVGTVSSILDAIPPDQQARLRVLAEIRTLLDDPAIAELTPDEQAEVRDLRPPPGLRPLTVADLPRSIREPLTERDGRVGLLVAVRPGPRIDQWNGHDLLRLAAAVRSLRLANGETVTTSGSSVVFADIIAAIEHDGPVVTAVAVVLLIVMVTLVVGRTRAVLAVLSATALGTLAMIAVAAVLGLRVNFLDFVALPITLGLGVDYAINIAHRAAESDAPATVLRTSGSAVLVCSLTTVVGYASLLVSENGAIRSFGVPLLIGEITSVIAAFAIVPAIMFANRIVRPARG